MSELVPIDDNLSPKEAAALIGVAVRTIYNWINNGRLKARRVGGGFRTSRAALSLACPYVGDEDGDSHRRPDSDAEAELSRLGALFSTGTEKPRQPELSGLSSNGVQSRTSSKRVNGLEPSTFSMEEGGRFAASGV